MTMADDRASPDVPVEGWLDEGQRAEADPRWRALLDEPGLAARLASHATSRRIALELHTLRHAAGLGMRELARAAGWDAAFVARLEAGRGAIPTPATVARYAAVCGASVGYVFKTGEEERVVPFGDDVLEAAPTRPEPEGKARRPRSQLARPAQTALRRAVAKA